MQSVLRSRTALAFAFFVLSVVSAAGSAHAVSIPTSPNPWDGATLVDPNQMSVYFEATFPRGKYDVYWGMDPTPPLVALGVPITSSFNSYPVGPHAYGTTYHWRVVIHDTDGSETSGAVWTYRTRAFNEPPSVPTVQAPANGSIKLPINVTLDYSMYDFEGPVASADVYLGTDQNPPLFADHVSPDRFTAVLQPNTTYFWRVVARDAGGLMTGGPTWTFTTANTTNQSPTPPSHYWRSDPGTPASTFNWDDASDPDEEPLTYDVYFAAGTDANHPLNFIGSTTGNSMQVPPLVQHHRYYWRVKVRDSVWTVGGEEQWFDYGTVPVLFSRFDAREKGSAVEVSWHLQSDEAMESYTLYRREGNAEPVAVASAPVQGVDGFYVDTSVKPGTTYHYELLIRTTGGDEYRSPVATVATAALGLTLHQNVPNPFNPMTTIRYDLPSAVRVQLSIVDVSGRRVRTLVDELQTPGSRDAIWNGRDDAGGAVASGVYFYVLEAGKQRLTKKLVLLK
jgi:hypothetical protein